MSLLCLYRKCYVTIMFIQEMLCHYYVYIGNVMSLLCLYRKCNVTFYVDIRKVMSLIMFNLRFKTWLNKQQTKI